MEFTLYVWDNKKNEYILLDSFKESNDNYYISFTSSDGNNKVIDFVKDKHYAISDVYIIDLKVRLFLTERDLK